MQTWQVLLVGEGFTVDGALRNCEISGFVRAGNVDAAVEKVCAIARQVHAELGQASGVIPGPVISIEEVVEMNDRFPYPFPVDHVEVHWRNAN